VSRVDTGLYSGVAAMGAAERRLDAIAANLANLDTNAYKRTSTSSAVFEVPRAGAVRRELAVRETVDFAQGVLERTGNPLDLALDGPGFFAVETRSGEAYTRDGSFRLDEAGVLLTQQGDPVVWEGARGTLTAVGEAITVDGAGVVRQGREEVGRLKRVAFAEPARLARDAHGLWRASPALEPTPAEAVVHQGALERSNASSVDELVSLIRVQRGFESATSLVRSIDQSYRRLNQQR
jgi:flagellar basal-body rod protein FlgF